MFCLCTDLATVALAAYDDFDVYHVFLNSFCISQGTNIVARAPASTDCFFIMGMIQKGDVVGEDGWLNWLLLITEITIFNKFLQLLTSIQLCHAVRA